MLEIKPVLDGPAVATACKRAGVPVHAGFYLYRATDGDEALASGLFEIRSSSVAVILYEAAPESAGDFFLFDGILRAGLNYASGQGVETGCIPEPFRQEHGALFGRLNYPVEPELNIVNFFKKYKNCTVL